MALIVNGKDIPKAATIKVGNTIITKIICQNQTVWEKESEQIYYLTCNGQGSTVAYQDEQTGRIIKADSSDTFHMGTAKEYGTAWQMELTPQHELPDINNLVPGSVILKTFYYSTADATEANCYLCAGQPYSQTGLQTIYNASSSIQYPMLFYARNPAGALSFQMPDQFWKDCIASNYTIGGRIQWTSCTGYISTSQVWQLYAKYRF